MKSVTHYEERSFESNSYVTIIFFDIIYDISSSIQRIFLNVKAVNRWQKNASRYLVPIPVPIPCYLNENNSLFIYLLVAPITVEFHNFFASALHIPPHRNRKVQVSRKSSVYASRKIIQVRLLRSFLKIEYSFEKEQYTIIYEDRYLRIYNKKVIIVCI